MRLKFHVRVLLFPVILFVIIVVFANAYLRGVEHQIQVEIVPRRAMNSVHWGVQSRHRRIFATIPERMYIIPLFSKEQFMNTLASYLDLCRIALDWKAHLVEPFICGSRLYGIHGWRDSWCSGDVKIYTYRTFYDFDQLNETLLCVGQCRMDSFEKFLHTSSRRIILLHSIRPWENVDIELKVKTFDANIVDCSQRFPHLMEKTTLLLHRHTQQRSLPPFEVAGMLCWRKETIVSTTSLRQAMNTLVGDSTYSVLFTSYGARDPDHTNSTFRDKIRSTAVVERRCANKLKAPATAWKLKGLSNTFIDSIGFQDRKFISVNIRIEKVVNLMTNQQIKCCLQTLNHTISTLNRKVAEQLGVLVTTDISPYGTDSCNTPHCKEHSSIFLQQLKALGLNPVYYDVQKFSTFNSRAIAGIVETEALTKGQFLVTVGTGLFQSRLIHDYIVNNRNAKNTKKHVYALCRDTLAFSDDITAKEVRNYVTLEESCM